MKILSRHLHVGFGFGKGVVGSTVTTREDLGWEDLGQLPSSWEGLGEFGYMGQSAFLVCTFYSFSRCFT
jgi:hypothetical protein